MENSMNIKKEKTTVIICCAGMGSRLKKNCPKALIDICGKPLIARQLDSLLDFDDVRVVVGYQANKVEEYIKIHYPNVLIVNNNEYKSTSAGDSIIKGIARKEARDIIVAMVGDILIDPEDFKRFIEYKGYCIAGCYPCTENPVLMRTDSNNNCISFSNDIGDCEWIGLIKVSSQYLKESKGTLYNTISPFLPLKVVMMQSREIDTPTDYINALAWYEKYLRI